MKILITGVGITGKSSFRRILVSSLRAANVKIKHYDTDEFKELRHPHDADCETPENFQRDVFYIIEDVHGPVEGAYLPLKEYNLIIYLLPDKMSHLIFWLSRCWRWFKSGYFSWERKTGWGGTGNPYDFRNIIPIIKAVIHDFKNREAWVSNDLKAINRFLYLIVRPYWTPHGIKFSFF